MLLAGRRVRALIVLQRDVGLNRYVEGGTARRGRSTKELLLSLFLPASPLHDGAVIPWQGPGLAAAGCLLPAHHQPNVSKTLGTRHRAAIGLTEETDAVVVVVSEEGGQDLARPGRDASPGISKPACSEHAPATGGMMPTLPRNLERFTARFAAASAPSSSRRRAPSSCGSSSTPASARPRCCRFPSSSATFPARGQTNAERVQHALNFLQTTSPNYLLLASLDTKRSPIILDLKNVAIGTDVRLKVRDEMVRVPRGVRILDIEPSRVPVRLEHVRRTSLPITLAPTGEPRDGFKVQALTATPEKVLVSGPASIVDRLTSLETEPFDLTDLSASAQKTVGLVRNDQLTVRPETVTIEITVAPVVTTREFKRLAIEVRNVDRPFQLRPPRVNLTVRGRSASSRA